MRHKWGSEEVLNDSGEPISGDHKNTCNWCGCIKTQKSKDGVHETQYVIASSISRLAPPCPQTFKCDCGKDKISIDALGPHHNTDCKAYSPF